MVNFISWSYTVKEVRCPEEQFDTMFVNDTGAKEAGIEGMFVNLIFFSTHFSLLELYIAQVQVVFKIPDSSNH